MKPGTRGRITRVFKPGEGAGYDAEFKAKGWTPMRVRKGEIDIHEAAVELVNLILDGEVDPKELAIGTKDERKEHDMSPAKARKTALQHLTRVDPKYYTKTEKALKSPPKATVIGDTTTIGMAAGGG